MGTFHAAGHQRPTATAAGIALTSPTGSPCAAPCPSDARDAGRIGPRRQLRAAVQRHRGRPLRQGRRRGRPSVPTIALRRPPRTAQGSGQCCSRPWPYLPRRRRRVGCRRRAPDRRAAGPLRARHPHRVAGPHHRRREGARLRGADVFCAPSLRRGVLRRGAARGHGRRHAPSWPPTCPATATRPGPGATPCSCLPGTSRRSPRALRRVLAEPGRRRRPGRRRGASRAESSSPWTAWPPATWSCTRQGDGGCPRRVRRGRPAGASAHPPRETTSVVAIVLVIIVVLLVVARRLRRRHLQRPGQTPEPHRGGVGADRRAAQAPLRPHPQPGGDGQGLRHPRA